MTKRSSNNDDFKKLYNAGMGEQEISDRLGVHRTTVGRWMKRLDATQEELDRPFVPMRQKKSAAPPPEPKPEKSFDEIVDAPVEQTVDRAVEIVSDPDLMMDEFRELLDEHFGFARKIRETANQIIESGVEMLEQSDESLRKALTEDVIERAVTAPIMTRDGEGEIVFEVPDDWTVLKRRTGLARELIAYQRDRLALIKDFANLNRTAIALQREAKGVDYAQELHVAMARVMSSGYMVSQ